MMGSLPKDMSRMEDLRLEVTSSSDDEGEEEEDENRKAIASLLSRQRRRRNKGRFGFRSHLSLGDLVGDQEEFWASLQHNHDKSHCTDQRDPELEWDYEDVTQQSSPKNDKSSSIWTFNDFMERYNQLYASLNKIQDLVFSSSATSANSKILNEALASHLEGIREQYERFVKRSTLMAAEFTDLREEVMCRVELLAAKWEILMSRSTTNVQSVDKSNPDHFHSDIEQDVRGLRKWLKEMEGKILPLQFKAKWSREAIEEKMKEIQVILRDIESHGRIVKSVLHLCEDLQKGEEESSPRYQGPDRQKASYYDVDRAFRVAKGLEDRWHGVWLRSLEWQCFLEQLAWDSNNLSSSSSNKEEEKKEVKHSSAPASLLGPISINSGFDSEDEPRCKVPKLSGLHGLTSSPSSTLLRTKRRKTSEYAHISNKTQENIPDEPSKLDLTQGEEKTSKQDDKCIQDQREATENESLIDSWNRVLEAAAAVEVINRTSPEQRKTLKVVRKKPLNMNPEILMENNRSGSPNNNTSGGASKTSSANDNSVIMRNVIVTENRVEEIDGDICKMATSESEQSLSSVSSESNNIVNINNNENKRSSGGGAVMLTSRKALPNCATYFFQHVSEDDDRHSDKGVIKSLRDNSYRGNPRRNPYDRSYLEEEDTDDHFGYPLSDSASNSDFLGSDTLLKELEEDNQNGEFSDSNAMESSTNTIVESSSSTFLNQDIQELVQRAEKLVQSEDRPKKRGSLVLTSGGNRRRRSRRSLVFQQASTPDGCDASAEATSTSDSEFSDDEDDEIEERCSSPGEMDTSISSHDQTLTGSCSTNALDVVTINTSALTLGSTATSKLKRYRRRSTLSASESHLVYSFKRSVSLNHTQKSRSVASIYGSSSSFGGVVKKRKGSGTISKKFAIPCISISSEEEEELIEDERRRRALEINPVDEKSNSKSKEKTDEEVEVEVEDEYTDPALSKKNLPVTESPRSVESEEDFWDQENYLSEHNYDEAIDEDTALRILNFGDDYRNFIDSMSDGVSSGYQPPKQHRRKIRRNPQIRDDRKDSMSESEVEDVRRVLNRSKDRFEETETQFKKFLESQPEIVLLEDYFSLRKTCQENMSCLAILMEPIFKESDSATLKKTGRELKGLLQKWDGLLRSIIRRIGLTEVLRDLEGDIQRLEKGLEEHLSACKKHEKIQSTLDLNDRISAYKTSIVNLTSFKSDLFNVNLGVHNFLAELACSSSKEGSGVPRREGSPLTSADRNDKRGLAEARLADRLKNKVVALYAKWDQVFHVMSGRLAECETALSKLTELEEEAKKLRLKTMMDSKTGRKSYCCGEDDDSGISGSCTESELAQRERLLERLRLLARELEQTLSPESKILKEISLNLDASTNELKNLLRNENNNHGESLQMRSGDSESSHPSVDHHRPRRRRNNGGRKRSWKSRIIRTAIPMQIGLFLMWLFTWIMEPACCDSSNTFFMAPQLRYVNGPPPI